MRHDFRGCLRRVGIRPPSGQVKVNATLRNEVSMRLRSVDQLSRDDGGGGTTLECASIERGVAGFAGALLYVVRPGTIQRKNSDVGGLARSELALLAENPRRTGGEEFD